MSSKFANIYDICDKAILRGTPAGEPGRNLRLLYRKSVANPLLKLFFLRGARHPMIPMRAVESYREMMREAMRAEPAHWKDRDWINSTFRPIADLLDGIENPRWRLRRPAPRSPWNPKRREVEEIVRAVTRDIFETWDKTGDDPHFPVAAQVVLTGDDVMTGEHFLETLAGLGAVEYQNVTMLFGFIRAFLMADPKRRGRARTPFKGIAEPLFQSPGWIWHRTAFYDVIFFEQLYNRVVKNRVEGPELDKLVAIMDSLMRYNIITSQEWLTTPGRGVRHPALTCLPKDGDGNPLCSLSKSDWQKKKDLGFDDYVPDVDTTFLGLCMARKWLDLVRARGFATDPEVLRECEAILDHPWVEIIGEYQIDGGREVCPPTIIMGNPLDMRGSVPLWFDKPFTKPDGRMVREVLGNEVCLGHNMDILDTLLVNRYQWKALEGENLDVVRGFLDFHHRAYASGHFRDDRSVRFYLPEIYINYTGRLYETWRSVPEDEQRLIDPEDKIGFMRGKALEYVEHDMLGSTLNPFDAALAVSSLVLLRYEPRDDGLIGTGLDILRSALGEGWLGRPYKAYEWTLVRYPSRILVGSPVATSLFALSACAEALHYLYGDRSEEPLSGA